MKVTKLDKKQNRYYVDTAKQPINIVGAKAVGKPITKLAMYESFGEPKKISDMLKAAREVLEGEGFTPAQARRASEECNNSAEQAAKATLKYINELLKDKYPDAISFMEEQLNKEVKQ